MKFFDYRPEANHWLGILDDFGLNKILDEQWALAENNLQ